MGAYLSEPIVEKHTESNGENGIHYGATSMQGWRINQEDAHNCILNFDQNCALFAVYDGHGGSDVSHYAATRFPDFLKSIAHWNEGRIGQALEDAFLKFDELLTREDVMEELKILAGAKKEKIEGEEVDEDKALLVEEAGLPLDAVLQRYGLTLDRNILGGGGNERIFVLPKIKIKREKKPPAKTTTAEDGNGPPTPPSSPDARSNAAAAAAHAKCDPSNGQENPEALPVSPSKSSPHQKLTRAAIKRKSRTTSSNVDEERNSAIVDSTDRELDPSNEEFEPTPPNGAEKTDNLRAASPLEELPQIKRFKDGNGGAIKQEMADSTTTISDESIDSIPTALEGDQNLNGFHSADSIENDVAVGADSTSDGEKPKVTSPKLRGKDVDSPMMVEEPGSINRANEEKPIPASRQNAQNKTCAMDESSGASEDDEDEDYNMEVEDEESSEEGSSGSDGIEEDEVVDEQDEMGVDEDEDDDAFPMPSGDTPGVDSGTTACVALIKGSTIYVANAGDSRCVLCRADKAIDLSLDHKPEDIAEKKRIESAGGKITADGRVNGGLNLSRAIGDHFYKRNSELPLRDQMITALPDIRVETLRSEDRFLVLACDGIWNSMSSQDVVDFVRARLAKGMQPAAICEELCDVCLAPNTIGDGTGCDNMTAIIVLLNQNSSPAVDKNEEEGSDKAVDGLEIEARTTL